MYWRETQNTVICLSNKYRYTMTRSILSIYYTVVVVITRVRMYQYTRARRHAFELAPYIDWQILIWCKQNAQIRTLNMYEAFLKVIFSGSICSVIINANYIDQYAYRLTVNDLSHIHWKILMWILYFPMCKCFIDSKHEQILKKCNICFCLLVVVTLT